MNLFEVSYNYIEYYCLEKIMEHIFEILTVIFCVSGAAFYLGKTLFFNKQSGCAGGCNKCSSNCNSIKQFDTKKIIKIHRI